MKWPRFRRAPKPTAKVKVISSGAVPSKSVYFEVNIEAAEPYEKLLKSAQDAIGKEDSLSSKGEPGTSGTA